MQNAGKEQKILCYWGMRIEFIYEMSLRDLLSLAMSWYNAREPCTVVAAVVATTFNSVGDSHSDNAAVLLRT